MEDRRVNSSAQQGGGYVIRERSSVSLSISFYSAAICWEDVLILLYTCHSCHGTLGILLVLGYELLYRLRHPVACRAGTWQTCELGPRSPARPNAPGSLSRVMRPSCLVAYIPPVLPSSNDELLTRVQSKVRIHSSIHRSFVLRVLARVWAVPSRGSSC